MRNSDLPSDGSLFLWFSCWPQPPPHISSDISDQGVHEEDVYEWLREHVFCDDRSFFFNSNSIHLMDPLVFENVCKVFSASREIDFQSDTIVWNMPEAEVDQTRTLRGVGYDAFNYTIWNVSFPTYTISDPETQRKLQRSFELKLLNRYIEQDSLDGCRVAVVGKEPEFWLANRISQGEKDVLLIAGIILFLVQTISLILVPHVGKKLVARRDSRKELDANEEEEEPQSIDEMLITSKGYLDIDIPQSNDVEKPAPVGDAKCTDEIPVEQSVPVWMTRKKGEGGNVCTTA